MEAGPIIARERIIWRWHDGDICEAAAGRTHPFAYGNGPTELIAAMRAFVASKFGDEIELP